MYNKQKFLLDSIIYKTQLDKSIPWFVAGGALTSVFSNQPINDLDIFFYNLTDLALLQSKLTAKNISSKFVTDSAISYDLNGVKVQLIKRVYGTPLEIINQFDFTTTMAAYIPNTSDFILGETFLYDLCQRELYFNINAKYPICSLWRTKKFIAKGFHLSAGEFLKLSLAINNLKIKTYKDLKEQLEGIDTLFLKELTDICLNKELENYDFRIALEIINKVLDDKLILEN